MDKNRRNFITHLSLGAAALLSNPLKCYAFNPLSGDNEEIINIGFITDLHHGFCHDAMNRLQVFLDDASSRDLDFIIQGGDFCFSEPAAQECIDLWNTYNGKRYHVLGNHDMDKGSKSDIMTLWGMQEAYYSFDHGPFHFVVLDGNHILKDGEYIDYSHANFYIEQERRSLFSPKQIEWLRSDLDSTDKQSIIISHQALDEVWDGWSSPNRLEVRKVIDQINEKGKRQKVIACFCGHHHLDQHSVINNVHYFQMNSASYYYTGEGFGSHASRATYKNALFAFISISTAGQIIVEGRQGRFQAPTPKDLNFPDADRITASISDRSITF